MKVFTQQLQANYLAKGGPAIYVVSSEFADFAELPAYANYNGRIYWKGRDRDWFDDVGYTMYRECDAHSRRNAHDIAEMVVGNEPFVAAHRTWGISGVGAESFDNYDPADYWKKV